MNKLVTISFFLSLSLSLFAQASEKAEDAYLKVITVRADKIVNSMTFSDEGVKTQVRDIIVEHYGFLNTMDEESNAEVAKIREELDDNKVLRDAKIDLRKTEKEILIRNHHFAFNAQLSQIIPEEQIAEVKDGLSYGVLNLTYTSYCDMIPDLNDNEKTQIMIWLIEAREHAIDAGSSKGKHAWFGKYKGRINNYLSAAGYDLQKERRQWELRLEEQKK